MKIFLFTFVVAALIFFYSSCNKDRESESIQPEFISENEATPKDNELLQPFLQQYRQDNAFIDSLVKSHDLFENWRKFIYTTHGLDSIPGKNILIDSLIYRNRYTENGKEFLVFSRSREAFYFHFDPPKNDIDKFQSEDIINKYVIFKVDQFRKVNHNDFIVRGEIIEIIDE